MMEIRVGCRMGGLRQACARTIHGYYILGWNSLFYVLFELLLYELTREAYEYNDDVRHMCGMIISFTTTTTITAVCVVVVDNSICFSDVTIGTTAGD